MIDLSVILPTYDEADNISELITTILASFQRNSVEIIVVDDDSPDGTWEIVRDLSRVHASVRLIHRRKDRGLTASLREGVAASTAPVVAWMDCDFSMPPAKLPELYCALQTCDVAVGSRYAAGGTDARDSRQARTASRIINTLARLLLNWRIRDYTSGFIMAKKAVLQSTGLHGDYGEYCIEFLYRAARLGYRVREVPYRCEPRQAGYSKTAARTLDFARKGFPYLKTILWCRLGSSRKTEVYRQC